MYNLMFLDSHLWIYVFIFQYRLNIRYVRVFYIY